ncbi:MaoC/PaaZ C-terminal domain-containing protein [Flammeovirga agarivorans]|uniref:Protein dehydratase n=1 Tax=Flammeovirga agarivorans TaxID=2726742 RepID=A0A7X8SPW2_9BACT|nr:MaoC/PaaZ C-terminal domain-containing protein [Flammeovirga agarivorans]NLR94152.1 protein dehydratase [Flammeovirga agarivorans]
MKVDKSLLLQQKPMLKIVGKTFLQTILPFLASSKKHDLLPQETLLNPPSKKLIESYITWSGGIAGNYEGILPPHIFSQYALPFGLSLLEKTPYKLAKVINQGVDIKVLGELKDNQPIFARTEIVDIKEDNGRARVHQKLVAGVDSSSIALEVHLYTAFIIGKREKKKTKREEVEKNLIEVGEWSVAKNDGFNFGVLTGDLNPLHWVDVIAKATPFKSTILHGFGQLAKTYELLQTKEGKMISDISIKFIKPVKLPNRGVKVLRSESVDANNRYHLELQDQKGTTLMVGSFCY